MIGLLPPLEIRHAAWDLQLDIMLAYQESEAPPAAPSPRRE